MKWTEIEDRLPIKGKLNDLAFVVDDANHMAVERRAKENPELFESLSHEYRSIGFTELGGTLRRRSLTEQFNFTRETANAGLCVLSPIEIVDDKLYYPFLSDARTLDVYLPASEKSTHAIVDQLIRDLHSAHKKRWVYGDRWSKNILIDPIKGVVHIDFDVEINGPFAKEFEIAQVIYYTLSAGKDSVIPILIQALSSYNDWFNLKIVERFVRGHAVFFDKTPYGGIRTQTQNLIEQLKRVL